MKRISLHASATDLSRQRFDRLVVLMPVRRSLYGTKNSVVYYACQCDCGKVTEVSSWNLTAGKVRSCGCLAVETRGKATVTHGMTEAPEYEVWCGMKGRCLDTKDKHYADYGGRGVKVCDEWNRSFAAFMHDIGPRPSPKHSIERIDNNGDYTPGNCRWATVKDQARNRRSTFWVTIGNRTQSLAAWADEYGASYQMVLQRIRKYGWDAETALRTPPKR